MANVTDSPSKGDDSTMELQSINKSVFTGPSILQNGSIDSAESMSEVSAVSALAQLMRSL